MEELATVLVLSDPEVAVITIITGTWIDMLKAAIPDASDCIVSVPEIDMQFLSRLTVIFSPWIGLSYSSFAKTEKAIAVDVVRVVPGALEKVRVCIAALVIVRALLLLVTAV
jgi:hypothetical protein